jgi:hypothetical protein
MNPCGWYGTPKTCWTSFSPRRENPNGYQEIAAMTTESARTPMTAENFQPDVDQPYPLPRMDAWPESVHVYDDASVWAVKTALAANRPLLISDEPGIGKSQLARAVAAYFHVPFLPFVVHARSECSDLLYQSDPVSRLAQAQVLGHASDSSNWRELLAEDRFVRPGPLWWAFDWASAGQQARKWCRVCGADPAAVREGKCCEACCEPPREHQPPWEPGDGCVVLIDEIDKADSEFPNGLLESLGNLGFFVADPQTGNPRRPSAVVGHHHQPGTGTARRVHPPLPRAVDVLSARSGAAIRGNLSNRARPNAFRQPPAPGRLHGRGRTGAEGTETPERRIALARRRRVSGHPPGAVGVVQACQRPTPGTNRRIGSSRQVFVAQADREFADMTLRTSHADLLRAFKGVSSPAHKYVASLCGFEIPENDTQATEQAMKQAESEAQERSRRRTQPSTPVGRAVGGGILRIMAPVGMTFRDSSEKAESNWLVDASPISSAAWRVPQNPPQPPRKPDLMPWPRLWPFLHRTHSRLSNGPKPAIGSIVAALARLVPLRRVPYEPVWRWTRDSWMLLDLRDALFPFHDDQETLRKRWFLLFGNEACRTKVCPDGNRRPSCRPPGRPSCTSAISGCWRTAGDRRSSRLGPRNGPLLDRIRFGPAASWLFSLCPGALSQAAVGPDDCQGLDLCVLERVRDGAADGARLDSAGAHVPETDAQALRQMAALAAPALRIERSLLRELRRLLPHQWNHPGVEYDFFHHASRNLDAVFVSRDKLAAAIERFRSLPPDTKQRIVELLRAHHADCAEIVRARETLLLNEGKLP